MTDAELEELDTLLEDLRLWFNAAPLHLCPTRDALIRGDMDNSMRALRPSAAPYAL